MKALEMIVICAWHTNPPDLVIGCKNEKEERHCRTCPANSEICIAGKKTIEEISHSCCEACLKRICNELPPE